MNTSVVAGILLLWLWLPLCGWAQLDQPYRFEQKVKPSEQGFTVISMKSEGLALVNGTNEYNHGQRTWSVEILDTTLTSVWINEVQLENDQNFLGYEYVPGFLYLLFRESEYQGHGFRLISMELAKKETRINKIQFELNFKITHFTVSGQNAIFGGYINYEPAVLLYDPSNEHPKVLPGLFVKDVSLVDLRMNQNQTFNVLLLERKTKEKDVLIVRTYDHEGNLLIDDSIPFEGKFSVLSAITSSLEREDLLVAGTYGEGTSNKQAIGVFTFQVNPFGDERILYTDFPSLEHFLEYLPAKRAEKVRTHAAQRKAAGLSSDFRQNVKAVRLEETKDGFYLLTEAYHSGGGRDTHPYWPGSYNPYAYGYNPFGYSPRYRDMYNMYNPYPYSSPRAAEFRMIQANVIKLTPQGQPTGDLSINLEDVKQPSLGQVTDFILHHDSIYLAYKEDDKVFFRRWHPGMDEDSLTSKLTIRTREAGEKFEDDDEGEVRYWYGSHFYVWGYQNIRGRKEDGEERRNVFYVNRLTPRH